MFPARYKAEFVELSCIGTGGFGSVYKVKNRLDGQHYAVKKITCKQESATGWLLLLREIRILAQLNHPNIIRYHTSWFEFENTGPTPLKIIELSDSERERRQSGKQLISRTQSVDMENASHQWPASLSTELRHALDDDVGVDKALNTSDSNDVIFSGPIDNKESLENVSKEKFASGDVEFERSFDTISDFDLSLPTNLPQTFQQTSQLRRIKNSENSITGFVNSSIELECDTFPTPLLLLYIQTELAHLSLASFISKRNNFSMACPNPNVRSMSGRPSKSLTNSPNISDNGQSIQLDNPFFLPDQRMIMSLLSDESRCLMLNENIMRQVMEGVDYLHSNQVIHRDLKPSNILLMFERPLDFRVVICDFGLSKRMLSRQMSGPQACGKDHSSDPEVFVCSVCNSSAIVPLPHSVGVGTEMYSSPEQLTGAQYGTPSDIYSLGIIMFELYSNLSTDMEKVHVFGDLRRRNKLPAHFISQFPDQADLILRMCSPDPAERPTARQILVDSFLFAAAFTNDLRISRYQTPTKDEMVRRLRELLNELETDSRVIT